MTCSCDSYSAPAVLRACYGTAMRRTQRLFALTEYLRGRRTGVTAEALASRFGVTIRTMYRDLDALREADLPLGAERGRGGGYALDRNYTLPPVNFTAREAAVMMAIGQFAIDLRIVPFTNTLRAGLEKLRSALSASAQRELLVRLEELKFLGVPTFPVDARVRETVERAWFENQPIHITYVDGNLLETTRCVRICSVIMDRHETRLDAEDLDSGERRHFRLDRVTRAKLLSEVA